MYRGSVTTAKITGTAYGRPASIEVTGDTVMWRAKPDATSENIVTTIHDIRLASFRMQRLSWPAVGFLGLGAVWILGDWYIVGAVAFTFAVVLQALRLSRPNRRLLLEVGSNQLVLEVDPDSIRQARGLAQRIDRAIRSGEMPASPPTLP